MARWTGGHSGRNRMGMAPNQGEWPRNLYRAHRRLGGSISASVVVRDCRRMHSNHSSDLDTGALPINSSWAFL